MKTKLIKESIDKSIDLESLRCSLYDHIQGNVYLRMVPYSRVDNDQEVDPISIDDAVKAIIEYLNENYIITQL